MTGEPSSGFALEQRRVRRWLCSLLLPALLALTSASCTEGADGPLGADVAGTVQAAVLDSSAIWASTETDNTRSVAWGDWDGDGDLDLAVGNYNQAHHVYENTGASLSLAWTSPETTSTHSVAWGDWDGDGDLDLAVGNVNQANRVYENTGGILSLAWTSPETDNTYSVAWGDWDGDGDLDLAVGNSSQANRVYENTGGGLSLAWTSPETDNTRSVAWGDWDGDGDLDLAVGNYSQANRVYENTGGGLSLAWTSPETDNTRSVAWGDWDGDGDLDLAVGNYNNQANRVYENHRISAPRLPDNPTHVLVSPPGNSAAAPFGYATATVIQGPTVTVPFVLIDQEGGPAPLVRLEYSTAGGGAWSEATTVGAVTGLSASPVGFAQSLDWNVGADGVSGDAVSVRVAVVWQAPLGSSSSIPRAEIAATSAPFRTYPCFPLDADNDGDGCATDCDDSDGAVFTGATEVCDAVDNDCDSVVDDGFDTDNDTVTTCGADGLPGNADDDCDDGDTTAFPGATETCNAVDDDCDTVVDDGFDTDNDGVTTCGADGLPGNADDDCDDGDTTAFPGATETCNAVDDDCDTVVDDGFDTDNDGVTTCGPDGLTGTSDDDCDDAAATVYPGAAEVCDSIDQDCDGDLVAAFTNGDADLVPDCVDTCVDADGDGLGTGVNGNTTCSGGTTTDGDDTSQTSCADTDTDLCDDCVSGTFAPANDGLDTDADGLCDLGDLDDDGDNWDDTDEAACSTDPLSSSSTPVDVDLDTVCDAIDTCVDVDGDGLGDGTNGNTGCAAGTATDADDSSATACGDSDNDTCDDCFSGSYSPVNDGPDLDGDGLCDAGDSDADGDGATNTLDCDDADATVYPNAPEICDEIDQDCDDDLLEEWPDVNLNGVPDCAETDDDGDGVPAGDGSDDDCDDTDELTYPGAAELCDGIDNDCDADIDEELETVDWYADADGDGFGDPASPHPENPTCEDAGDGWVQDDGDCDDTAAAVNPDAIEVCNELDDDCDGTIDVGADNETLCGCEGVPTPSDEETDCTDGLDNDCDGAVDTDDRQCEPSSCTGCQSSFAPISAAQMLWLLPLLVLRRRRRPGYGASGLL